MVNTDVRKAKASIASVVDEKLVAKWNDLADATNEYRNAAYIAPIEQLSLDDLAKQIQVQVNKEA